MSPLSPAERTDVLISFCNRDKRWLEQLRTMLRPLVRLGDIVTWDSIRLEPGSDRFRQLEAAIRRARVAVLLISPDYLADDSIAAHELPPLLEAARDEGVTILWVPVRHSLVKETALWQFQAVLDPAKPLQARAAARRDAALLEVCERIQQALGGAPASRGDRPGADWSGDRELPCAEKSRSPEHLLSSSPEPPVVPPVPAAPKRVAPAWPAPPAVTPILPANYVARPRELEELAGYLVGGRGAEREAGTTEAGPRVAITTALHGAGGYGKTFPAQAPSHNDRALEVFSGERQMLGEPLRDRDSPVVITNAPQGGGGPYTPLCKRASIDRSPGMPTRPWDLERQDREQRLHRFLTVLEMSEPEICLTAIDGVWKLFSAYGDHEIPALVVDAVRARLVKDTNGRVRREAALRFMFSGWRAGTAPLSDLVASLDDPDHGVSEAAARALGQWKPANGWYLTEEDQARVVYALIRALATGHITVRTAAAQALGGFPVKEAVQALIDSLDAPEVCSHALAGLSQQGTAAELAVPAVLNMLRSTSPAVRARAAETLGSIALTSDAVDEALESALEDTAEEVCIATAKALGRRVAHSGRSLNALIRKLKGGDKHGWKIGVEGLRQAGPGARAATPALLEGLEDPDQSIRSLAATTLGAVQGNAADVVPALARALEDKENSVCYEAARALAQYGADAVRALDSLLEAFRREDNRIREAVLQAIGSMKPDSTGPLALAVTALEDRWQSVRERAALTIGELGQTSAGELPRLLNYLDKAQGNQHRWLIKALGQIGPAAHPALPRLLTVLRQRAVQGSCGGLGPLSSRCMAAEAIGVIGPGSPIVLQALREALLDFDPAVRCSAARALGEFGPEAASAVPILREMVCRDDAAQTAAVVAVGKLGAHATEAIPDLIQVLDSPSRSARRCAAETLGKLGPMAASAAMALRQRIEKEGNSEVRHTMEVVLSHLTDFVDEQGLHGATDLTPAFSIGPPTEGYPRVGRAHHSSEVLRVSDVLTHELSGINLMHVPAGSFLMGSDTGNDDELPVHRVNVSSFWMAQDPVTNEQYERFLKATGYRQPEYWGNDQYNLARQPVVGVTWEDAKAFCHWLTTYIEDEVSSHSGIRLEFRLPSEAEWEYAARGPDNRIYPWGDEPPTRERACLSRGDNLVAGGPAPVGQHPHGTAWCGCQDLAGNVREWCEDHWRRDYYSAPTDGSARTGGGADSARILRGGAYCDNSSSLRGAARCRRLPTEQSYNIGFRVVASAAASNQEPQPTISPKTSYRPAPVLTSTPASLPPLTSIPRKVLPSWKKRISLVLLTVADVELHAVLRRLEPPGDETAVLKIAIGQQTYFLGRLGAVDVALTRCAMGALGRDAAILSTQAALDVWKPRALLMVGIAFGKDPAKQAAGDVLVASQVVSYEPQRVGEAVTTARGPIVEPGPILLDRFKHALEWKFARPDGSSCRVHVGPLLSGEKLVDDPAFKTELFKAHPQAIGARWRPPGCMPRRLEPVSNGLWSRRYVTGPMGRNTTGSRRWRRTPRRRSSTTCSLSRLHSRRSCPDAESGFNLHTGRGSGST